MAESIRHAREHRSGVRLRERYHAISAERRVKHPGVLALAQAARAGLFASV